jgi:hypothetical protein
MKQEFVASLQHDIDPRGRVPEDVSWCVRIYQQPDRFIAKTVYMKENEAQALAEKLNAQFEK